MHPFIRRTDIVKTSRVRILWGEPVIGAEEHDFCLLADDSSQMIFQLHASTIPASRMDVESDGDISWLASLCIGGGIDSDSLGV
jgi:hypothetical protein